MENQLVLLSTEQATSLIHSLGLGPVCALLQNQSDGELLSSIPGMDSSSLQSFLVFVFSLQVLLLLLTFWFVFRSS